MKRFEVIHGGRKTDDEDETLDGPEQSAPKGEKSSSKDEALKAIEKQTGLLKLQVIIDRINKRTAQSDPNEQFLASCLAFFVTQEMTKFEDALAQIDWESWTTAMAAQTKVAIDCRNLAMQYTRGHKMDLANGLMNHALLILALLYLLPTLKEHPSLKSNPHFQTLLRSVADRELVIKIPAFLELFSPETPDSEVM